jgi:hypothetical protein
VKIKCKKINLVVEPDQVEAFSAERQKYANMFSTCLKLKH